MHYKRAGGRNPRVNGEDLPIRGDYKPLVTGAYSETGLLSQPQGRVDPLHASINNLVNLEMRSGKIYMTVCTLP